MPHVRGQCTLRAATQEANANPGADVIHILPGTYPITIAPINENAANVGDFEILDPVMIAKAPGYLGNVIVDGGTPLPSAPVVARGLDRLFEIHPGAGDVTFRNVTLQNGFSPEEGGAIQNWSLGKLTLDGVTVKDSCAEKAGGGLNHADLNDYEWTTEPPNLDAPSARAGRDRALHVHRQRIGRRQRRGDQQRLGRHDHDLPAERHHAQPRADQAGPARARGVRPRRPGGLPDLRERDREPGAMGKVGTLKISDSTVSLNAAEGNGAGVSARATASSRSRTVQLTATGPPLSGGGLYAEGGKVVVDG